MTTGKPSQRMERHARSGFAARRVCCCPAWPTQSRAKGPAEALARRIPRRDPYTPPAPRAGEQPSREPPTRGGRLATELYTAAAGKRDLSPHRTHPNQEERSAGGGVLEDEY